MDAQQMKNMVQELRKAHFNFGEDTDNPFVKKNQVPEYTINVKENLEQSKNVMAIAKKVNYSLATPGFKPADHYVSIAKNSFVQPQNFQQSTLDDAMKKDLRKQHFTFGNEDISQIKSEANSNFVSKPIEVDTPEEREKKARALRQHAHDFGDNKQYFQSIYQQLIVEPSKQPIQNQTTDLKEKVQQLRKTNLVLGNQNMNYQTTNRATYNQGSSNVFPYTSNQGQKERSIQEIIKDTRESHLCVGTDQVNYNSQAKSQYTQKERIVNDMDKEAIKDLRATHFDMGNDQLNYKAEYKQQYPWYNQTNNKAEFELKNPRQTNIRFGEKNSVEVYDSVYVKLFNGEPQKEKGFEAKDQRKQPENVVMGFDPKEYDTENKQQFQLRPRIYNPKDQDAINKMRQHSSIYGTDPQQYETTTSTAHDNKFDQKIENQMDPSMKKELRSQHFKYGYNNYEMKTSQTEIGSKQGPPAKLNPELAKQLRRHNYVTGTDRLNYETDYRKQFNKA